MFECCGSARGLEKWFNQFHFFGWNRVVKCPTCFLKTATRQSPGFYGEMSICSTERKWEANEYYHSGKYIFLSPYDYCVYKGTHVYIWVHVHSQILSSAMHTLLPLKHGSHTHASEGKKTAGYFSVATLITELNDHCVQLKLWPLLSRQSAL